jgi:hypothetical protein
VPDQASAVMHGLRFRTVHTVRKLTLEGSPKQ